MGSRVSLWLCAALPVVLQAQAAIGNLLYADPAGRGIRLTVVEGGPPDAMTIRREEGLEGQLRMKILTFAGPEHFQASEVQELAEPIPSAWTVDGRTGGTLFRAGGLIYWRYLPGQALPAMFTFDRKIWTLQSAELPGRKFTVPR